MLHELFQIIWIWDQQKIPEDWSRGLIIIVKLPKMVDLTVCGNWREITLMSTAAKVMGRVIITQMRDGVDHQLRPEQAGRGGLLLRKYLCCAILLNIGH